MVQCEEPGTVRRPVSKPGSPQVSREAWATEALTVSEFSYIKL